MKKEKENSLRTRREGEMFLKSLKKKKNGRAEQRFFFLLKVADFLSERKQLELELGFHI